MPVLPTVYAENRKESYGIKSYIFLIPLFNIVMPVLLFLMLQYESFHTVFSAPESMSKRLRNCINGKIPKIDAVRDLLSGIDPEEVRKIHERTIDTLKKNRVFRGGPLVNMWWPELTEWNCSAAQKNPARTALSGKIVQVKRNISTGVWSA